MSEYNTPKSFRNQSIKIAIGPYDENGKQKQIEVSDLPYGKHKEFIKKISAIWMRSKVIPATGEMFNQILTKQISTGKQPIDAIEEISKHVLSIFEGSTDDEKISLLKLLTSDQVTDVDIEKMTGPEINGMLIFLIERNLESEKNLEASLNSILSQTGQTIEK